MRYALATWLLLAAPALAQDLVFDPALTADCVAAAGVAEAGACIGRSAEACFTDTEGGQSTLGISACLERELAWWDGRLNDAYGRLRAIDADEDADPSGFAPPVTRVEALRAMQRAWIAFRDATCDYERAQWGGGTGGGPATIGCLMRMIARQSLYLEEQATSH